MQQIRHLENFKLKFAKPVIKNHQHSDMSALPAVANMNKEEVQKELFLMWERYPPKEYTLVMNKSLLQEIRDEAMPKTKIGLPKLKEELLEMAKTQGLPIPTTGSGGTVTVGKLQRMLTDVRICQTELVGAKGTTIFTLGKHKGASFHQIVETNPQFCQWAVDTMIESKKSHPMLTAFADYVTQMQEKGIASFTKTPCQACGTLGHWKAQCPLTYSLEKGDEVLEMKTKMNEMIAKMEKMESGFTLVTGASASTDDPMSSKRNRSMEAEKANKSLFEKSLEDMTPEELEKVKSMIASQPK